MDLVIRPICENELGTLVQLCQEHAAYEGSPYSHVGKAEALREHIFLMKQGLHCLVVDAKQQLVGYTFFFKQFSTWEAKHYIYMDCLYLTASHRNLGLGKRLLGEIKKYALRENYSEIQWQTPLTNAKAIKFYEREGAQARSKARFFMKI